MLLMSLQRSVFIGALSLFLTACGGGGGGGGGDDGGGNTGGGSSEPVYSASTQPAAINETAVLPYFFNAIDISLADDGFFENRQSMAIPAQVAKQAAARIGRSVKNKDLSPSLRERIDETEACESGSVRLTGNLDDQTGVGVVTKRFNNCIMDGVLFTGSVSISFLRWDGNDSDPNPIDMDVTYNALRTSFGDSFLEINGTVNQRNMTGCEQSATYNVVWDLPGTADDVYYKGLSQEINSCDYSLATNGRIYLGDQGYVDVTTVEEMEFTVWDASEEGNGLQNMRSGKIKFQNGTEVLELSAYLDDTRNDLPVTGLKIYSSGKLIKEIEFPSYYVNDPVLSDISDQDNDGMFDGWETYYGFSPEVDDSLEDADGDGFNNLTEFLGNYNPKDSGEAPYAYLAANVAFDDGDPGHFIAEVDESISIRINVSGSVSQLAATGLGTYILNVELPDLGEWSVSGGSGCEITQLNEATKQLRCDQMPLAPLIHDDQYTMVTVDALTLNLVGKRLGGGHLVPTVSWGATDQEWVNSTTINVQASDALLVTGSKIRAFSLGHNKNVLVGFFPSKIGDGTPQSYIVQGELHGAPKGASFPKTGDYSSNLQNCQISDFYFVCEMSVYDLSQWHGGHFIPLTSAVETGIATLKLTIISRYRSGKTFVNSSESKVVFGLPTASLQQKILDGLTKNPDEVIYLPDGIYVGSLDLVGAKVKAAENFHLYAIDSSPNVNNDGYSPSTILLGEGSILNGGRYYVRKRAFTIESETVVRNATFNMMAGHKAVATIKGSSLFENNKFIYSEGDEDEFWGEDGMFLLISDSYHATWRNNIFVVGERDVHVFLGAARSVTAQISNNTFIKMVPTADEDGFMDDYNGMAMIINDDGVQNGYQFENNLIIDSAGQGSFSRLIDGHGSPDINANNNLMPLSANALGGNNIYTDTPMLDLETFTPLPGSPAIDAGADLSAEFTTDFYGKPRPVGAGFDIGAVERQAP